jgi:hypothetical protein
MHSAWLLLLLALASALPASALELVRVWPGSRTADSFERISEYFTGRENPGRQTILRSQPAERGGYYWLIRTKAPVTLHSVILEITVTAPGTNDPVTHAFRTDLPAGSHVTLAGLTGADWPDPKVDPVTWRVRVLDANGTELAHEASFLWTSPER